MEALKPLAELRNIQTQDYTLDFLNIVCTLNWNYSHLFIICISLYLSSVLEQINKKLLSSEGQFLPSSFWKKLREDYSTATRLVRIFDHYINTIIFVSFASNLFFICLQLFYILSLFNGYEYIVYMLTSITFIMGRSLIVALIASKVHSATQVAAPVLYAVPSPVYCTEVQRFIEQVHGESVALTGMNFFQVTRELLLSVAGTIVTYELVLLQFTSPSMSESDSGSIIGGRSLARFL
ncbi:gustatory receptor for sugar taste 64f-like [Pieris rapae]|uniref:gustatory receptor for sugar taste 64f-like n=1 Tax=Pieris rapae TaxID=64459 RepID=UPI001E27CA2E|nr:gustatory receptor for sugar taste 64f-like [Pieris rapae]